MKFFGASSLLRTNRPKIMEIAVYGNPSLRKKAEPVEEVTDEIRELAADMIVTMLENEIQGVGLAAPQVGVNLRLVALATSDASEEPAPGASPGERILQPRMPLVLVNPEISEMSEIKMTASEGCLSFPGISGGVERPVACMLRAFTLDGERIEAECSGLLSRCLQHEIDHLDGVLFVDYFSKEQSAEAKAHLKKLMKLGSRQSTA